MKLLKAICEALIDGNIDEANRLARDSDLLVHGSSISVCYDSKGNEYTVRRGIVDAKYEY